MAENEVKTSFAPAAECNKNYLGRYAVSIAGHDSGRVYVIVGIAALNAAQKPQAFLLADGRSRKAKSPKLKKCLHVRLLGGADGQLAQKLSAGAPVTDAELVHSVKCCKKEYALH